MTENTIKNDRLSNCPKCGVRGFRWEINDGRFERIPCEFCKGLGQVNQSEVNSVEVKTE